MTGFTYAVDVTAFDPSWLSELTLGLGNSSGTGVDFSPSSSATSGNASFSGSLDLVNTGNAFTLGSDGLLQLQFFESFDDLTGADGRWNSASFAFEFTPAVPEPETLLLLTGGLAALAAAVRRRRRTDA